MHMGSILLALMPLLLPPVSAGPPAAEPAGGSLSGIVLSPEEAAVSGATVEVLSPGAGVRVLVACDEHGLYRIDGLPAATDYVVRVARHDALYQEAVQDRVVVRERETRTESFRLFYTVEAYFRVRYGEKPPVVNLTEIGNRTQYDHVFLEGLPIWAIP